MHTGIIKATIIISMIRFRMNKNYFYTFLLLIFIASCSIFPGISKPSSGILSDSYVYLGIEKKLVPIIDIDKNSIQEQLDLKIFPEYKISTGDVLTFTVWGQPEAFPDRYSPNGDPFNSRTVDTQGNIFFPWIGLVGVRNKTITEIRSIITNGLEDYFVDPQLDLTVTKYNKNQNVYLIGEFVKPMTITLGVEKISLKDAIGIAKGINPVTSSANDIYVLRTYNNQNIIYRAKLYDASYLLLLDDFYLQPMDTVFVGASGFTRWNRVIGQLFPFASFLNQIDNLED